MGGRGVRMSKKTNETENKKMEEAWTKYDIFYSGGVEGT